MLAGRAGYAACTVHLLLPLKRQFSPVTSSISLAESVSVLASFASWRQSVNLAAMWGLFLECSLAYRKLGTGICAILHTLELAFHGIPDLAGIFGSQNGGRGASLSLKIPDRIGG